MGSTGSETTKQEDAHFSSDESEPKEGSNRDAEFYFENVVFKVEDTLFCIPKHGLNVAGTVFGDMFLLPPGRIVEGRDDTHPVILEGVSKVDFRGFLKVVYPSSGFNPLSYDEWRGVLRLGTKWYFRQIRARAIQELSVIVEGKDACDKIMLGKEHRVHRWLLAGYTDLVCQPNIPSPDLLFSRGLDPFTVASLHYAMASVLAESSGSGHHCNSCGVTCTNSGKSTHGCSNCGNRGSCSVAGDKKTVAKRMIEDIFKSELASMEVCPYKKLSSATKANPAIQ